ncbi:MAG: iron response transcriptional regulator IrrA [Pseudomonadota bacterium]
MAAAPTHGRTTQAALAERLAAVKLRPTRQRLALAQLLFGGRTRHLTAEQLHRESRRRGVLVSLATVYNTLNQFTRAGLLREVVIDSGRSYFDTNTAEHHHFFAPETGRLTDIPATGVQVTGLPAAPAGTRVAGVEVIVRISRAARGA